MLSGKFIIKLMKYPVSFRGGWGTNMLTESCHIDLNTKLVNCTVGTLPAFDYYLSYPEMFYLE